MHIDNKKIKNADKLAMASIVAVWLLLILFVFSAYLSSAPETLRIILLLAAILILLLFMHFYIRYNVTKRA